MPGRPAPERPYRKWTRNPDYALYVSGGVAHFLGGLIFGIPFFCGGVLCLATVVAGLLGLTEPRPDASLANWVIGGLGVLVIGLGHSIVGFLLIRWAVCSPEWTTFDRIHGLLTKQTGVLCFRRFAK